MLIFLRKELWDIRVEHSMWQYKPRRSNYYRKLYSQKLGGGGGQKIFCWFETESIYYNHGKNIYKYQPYNFFLILEVTEKI